MASYLPCFCAAVKPKPSLELNKPYGAAQARAQSFRDEGNPKITCYIYFCMKIQMQN